MPLSDTEEILGSSPSVTTKKINNDNFTFNYNSFIFVLYGSEYRIKKHLHGPAWSGCLTVTEKITGSNPVVGANRFVFVKIIQ